jgi:class III poly(R)-hydroxyalkanoic acid synthase PhaE subunit
MSTNGTSSSESSQAASMMDAVVNAQQRWMKTMASMAGGDMASSSVTRLARQWNEALVGSMGAWTDESEPVMQATMERMAHSQSAMMELFQLAVDAWKQIGDQSVDRDDLPRTIEEHVEGFDEQVRHAISTWSTATQDVQAMWQQFGEAMQGAGLPFDVLRRMPGMMSGPAEGEKETPLRALFDQMYKATEVEHFMERMLDSPGIGLSREFNEKVQRGFKAFQEYQRASVRYQSIVANIWTQALQRFVYQVGERVQAGEELDGLRDLTTIWTQAADDVFITAFRSDDYLDAQSDLLSAAMRFRTRRRDILEEYQQAIDQPTRSELDEVHELLYRLRKENKALRKELDALKREVGSLREEQDPAMDTADDLTVIKGIGAATAEQLRDAGFSTYAALASATPKAVRDALGRPIGDDQINAWKQAARQRA